MHVLQDRRSLLPTQPPLTCAGSGGRCVSGSAGSRASDRDAPEGEPALELRLHRKVRSDLRLEAQLALVVAALVAPRGDERVEAAALVVIDPVDGPALVVPEGEHGAQDALAVAAALQCAGDRVDADHQVERTFRWSRSSS